MKIYGTLDAEKNTIKNFSIDLGVEFPSAPRLGTPFYLTAGENSGLYLYTQAGWVNTSDILTGTNNPNFTPKQIGQLYVNTTNRAVFISLGTATASDWVEFVLSSFGNANPTLVPRQYGQVYVNSMTKTVFIATGTASSTDWHAVLAPTFGSTTPQVAPAYIGQTYVHTVTKDVYVAVGLTVNDWLISVVSALANGMPAYKEPINGYIISIPSMTYGFGLNSNTRNTYLNYDNVVSSNTFRCIMPQNAVLRKVLIQALSSVNNPATFQLRVNGVVTPVVQWVLDKGKDFVAYDLSQSLALNDEISIYLACSSNVSSPQVILDIAWRN